MEQHHLHTKQRQFWALWKCLFWVFWKRTGPWVAMGTSPCQRGQRRGRSVHVSVPLELPWPSVISDHVNTALGGTQCNRSSARNRVPATQPLCRGQDPRETPERSPRTDTLPQHRSVPFVLLLCASVPGERINIDLVTTPSGF